MNVTRVRQHFVSGLCFTEHFYQFNSFSVSVRSFWKVYRTECDQLTDAFDVGSNPLATSGQEEIRQA